MVFWHTLAKGPPCFLAHHCRPPCLFMPCQASSSGTGRQVPNLRCVCDKGPPLGEDILAVGVTINDEFVLELQEVARGAARVQVWRGVGGSGCGRGADQGVAGGQVRLQEGIRPGCSRVSGLGVAAGGQVRGSGRRGWRGWRGSWRYVQGWP